MHLHATAPGRPLNTGTPIPRPCFPLPCEQLPGKAISHEEILKMTIDEMDKNNIVLGFVSDELEDILRWKNASPERFMISPFITNPEQVDLQVLRKEYEEGKLQGMGELGTMYNGIPPNSPLLEPIFDIAEEFNVPVLIHLQGIGPPTPKFSIAAGHPELIEEVLKKHPTLRIYLENAGFPFVKETISLMYMYPELYADISTITWIVPPEMFSNHLKILIDAGLGKRLMFGSDQMAWPEVISIAIDAINSADFLTEKQKRDIFYNNAARFLKLSEEQIAKHHEN